jgi:hypothetical protein
VIAGDKSFKANLANSKINIRRKITLLNQKPSFKGKIKLPEGKTKKFVTKNERMPSNTKRYQTNNSLSNSLINNGNNTMMLR